ncbi:protein-S-isoprenylcysteine O-methyltransferase Ste14 [Rhizobium sp. SG_E_25_P2]|jgi:protein-S-isoprenylcysteine O-methyltransferase Ste14|uniref:methyltransferase family protein n=1 Tax=Rhizobium sp. SG_E_25_P2 TaxID=2879942 RepID=UPI002474F8C2|nr:isoprenylcysteine carboxylmethyltransferase family protein [Rhizobium sp. SG_E_25_P2]MDH6269813.1 protein-S-isoprenylcysteine O-methyltransferase Ste14 [Rhizobium sp. SG_E_25_P2]
MNVYRARPVTYPWPTAFFLVILPLSTLCYDYAPIHMLNGVPLLRIAISSLMIGAGIVMAIWAIAALKSHHTALGSMKNTSRLVTTGPFRLTRNPIYLGYTVAALGLALATNNLWTAGLAVCAAAATHLWVIRREEQFLQARFGYEFERYRQRTRAWL